MQFEYEYIETVEEDSVNCPAHKPLTLKEVRYFLESSSVWDSEYIYQRKALLLQKFDEFIANKSL